MIPAIEITLDRANLERFRRLSVAGRTEAAKSLTFTAERAQTAWRALDHVVFHMRNTWLDKGVRIKAATPGNLVAQVGSIDKYFERHTIGIGAEKKGADGPLLVPFYSKIGDVRTHRQLRAALRGMANTKRKPFVMHTRSGKTFLARRLGKERLPVTIIGELRDRVHITPRFDAEGMVYRTVQATYPTVYERLLLAWAAR